MTPTDSPADPTRDAGGGPQRGLLSWSFLGLTSLQFLTVLNDNTYRWLVVPIGYVVIGPQHKGLVLTLGVACFAVPYILLVAPAGYLADRFSKRSVMAGCMLLQAVIVILGVGAILITNAVLVFSTLALMGAQGALLAPSKGGTVPETVRPDRVSAANGIMGMANVLAAVVGSILGNTLYVLTQPVGKTNWPVSAITMIGIALLGFAATLLVLRRPAADPHRPLPTRLFEQTSRDLTALTAYPALLGAATASAYLWFLAALSQVNVYLLATTSLHITQEEVGLLLAIMAAGVAAGSLLAGAWSAGRVEMGLVPIGAAVMAAAAIMMYFVSETAPIEGKAAYYWSCFYLCLVGVGGGLFDIPLVSYLQAESPERSRGQILAAANFLIFAAMLVASGVFWLLTSVLGYSAGETFLFAGIATAVAFFVILSFVPRQTVRALRRPFHGLRWLLCRVHP